MIIGKNSYFPFHEDHVCSSWKCDLVLKNRCILKAIESEIDTFPDSRKVCQVIARKKYLAKP